MRTPPAGLLVALALVAPPALAQPADPAAPTDCAAQKAAIEQAMDAARAKGQMLQRRRLAETLAQLQESCRASTPSLGRATEIQRLEHEVRTLQDALDRARERLRTLKNAAP